MKLPPPLSQLRSEFWRHAATLITGTGMGQLITLAALPILSRLYSPEAFGIAAIYIAAVLTLLMLINGGYDLAVMLPKKDQDAHRLVILCVLVAFAITTLLYLLLLVLENSLLDRLKLDELEDWIWVLPLNILVLGITQPVRIALNRLGNYRALARIRVIKSAAQALISLIWGFIWPTPSGLLWAYFIAQLAMMLCFIYVYLVWLRKQKIPIFITGLSEAALSFRDFPQFSLVGNWLNYASKQLPFFLLPALYASSSQGEFVTGQYSKTDQILAMPLGLFSLPVGDVFYQRASLAWQKGPEALAQITRSTFRQMALLGLPFLLLIAVAGPFLFTLVLGSNWEPAGIYAQYMIPAIYLTFVSAPISSLVDIRRKLRPVFFLNLFTFAIRLGALLVGGMYYSPDTAIIAYAIASFVMVVLQLIYQLYLGGLIFQAGNHD